MDIEVDLDVQALTISSLFPLLEAVEVLLLLDLHPHTKSQDLFLYILAVVS